MPGNIIYIHLADGNIQVPIMPEGYAFLYDMNTQRATAPALDTYSGGIADRRLIIAAQEYKNTVLTTFEEVMRRNGFPQGKHIVTPISFLTEVGFALKEGETVCNAVIKGSTVLLFNAVLLPILPLQAIVTASRLSRLIEIPDNATRSIPLIFCLNPLGFDPDPITMIRAIQAPSRIMDMAMQSFNHLIIKAKDYAFSDYPLSQNTLPPGPLVGSALPAILFQQRMQLFPESTLQNLITVHKQVFGEAFDFTAFPSQLTPVLTGPSSAINPLAFIPEGIKPKSVFETNSFMRNLKELTSRIHLDDSDRIEIRVNSDGSFDVTIGTKAIAATWSRLHGFQQKRKEIDRAESQFQRAETEYTDALAEAVSKLNAGDPTALDAVHRATQKQGQRKQGLQQLKHAFGELNDKTTVLGIKIHEHSKEIREQATQGTKQCNLHKEAVMRDDALLLSLEATAHAQKSDLTTASTRAQEALQRDPTNPLADQIAKHIQSQQLTKQAFAELSAGHFASASEQAQKALHFNPDNTVAQDLISVAQSYQTTKQAVLALAQDREADAFTGAQKAMELHPDNSAAKQIMQVQAARGDLFQSQLFSFVLDHSVPWLASKVLSQEVAEKISQTVLSCTHILTEIAQNTARYQEAAALVSLGFSGLTPGKLRQLGWSGGFRIADSVLTMLSAYSENPRIQQTKVATHFVSSSLTTSAALTAGNMFNPLQLTLAVFNTLDAIQYTMGPLVSLYPNFDKLEAFRTTRSGLALVSRIRQNDNVLKSIECIPSIQLLVQLCPVLIKNQFSNFMPNTVRDFFGKSFVAKLFNPYTLTAIYIGKLVVSIRDAYEKDRQERQNQINKLGQENTELRNQLEDSRYADFKRYLKTQGITVEEHNRKVRLSCQLEYGAFFLDVFFIIFPAINQQFLNSARVAQTVNLFGTLARSHINTLATLDGMDTLLETHNPFSSSLLKSTFSPSNWQNLSLYLNIFRSALPLVADAAEYLTLITPEKRNISRTVVEPSLEFINMVTLGGRTVISIQSWRKIPNPGKVQCATSVTTLISYGYYLYEQYLREADDLPENPVYLSVKAAADTIASDIPFNLYQVTLLYPSVLVIPTPIAVLSLGVWLSRKFVHSYTFQSTNNRLSNIHRLIEKISHSEAVKKLQEMPAIDSFFFSRDFNHQLSYLQTHSFLCGIGSLRCADVDLEAFTKATTGAHEQAMLNLQVLDDLQTAQQHILKAISSDSIFDFSNKRPAKNTHYQIQTKIARRNMLLIDSSLKLMQKTLSCSPRLKLFINGCGIPKITYDPHTLELIRETSIYYSHHQQYFLELQRQQLLQDTPDLRKKLADLSVLSIWDVDRGFVFRAANIGLSMVDNRLRNDASSPCSRQFHVVIRFTQTCLETVFCYQALEQMYETLTDNENGGLNDAVFSVNTYFAFTHFLSITALPVSFLARTNYTRCLFEQTRRYTQENVVWHYFSRALTPYAFYRSYSDLPLLLSLGPYINAFNRWCPFVKPTFNISRSFSHQINYFLRWGPIPWLIATTGALLGWKQIQKATETQQKLVKRSENIIRHIKAKEYDKAEKIIRTLNKKDFQDQSSLQQFIALKSFVLLNKTKPEPLVVYGNIHPLIRKYEKGPYDRFYYDLLAIAIDAIFKLGNSNDISVEERLAYFSQAKGYCKQLIKQYPGEQEYVQRERYVSSLIDIYEGKMNPSGSSESPEHENRHRWAKYGFLKSGKDKFPRDLPGWKLHDVNDKGNCFYEAVAHQLETRGHDYVNEVPEGTSVHNSLRLRIQGARFRDYEWADFAEIKKLTEALNCVVAIADTRSPPHGSIVYYFTDNEGQPKYTNNKEELAPGKYIIWLAYTGNHYLSVVETYQECIIPREAYLAWQRKYDSSGSPPNDGNLMHPILEVIGEDGSSEFLNPSTQSYAASMQHRFFTAPGRPAPVSANVPNILSSSTIVVLK